MRLIDIREHSIPISRYRDLSLPSGGLTTSIVAVITDIIRDGRPVVGYGFASIGRFAQSGLIRDRFGPRLLKASEEDLRNPSGDNFDPFRAWQVMMAGEKPGGHGERCVAVGTLDMAIWDAAAKIAGLPVYRYLAQRVGRTTNSSQTVRVYAGGGYYYPRDDIARLSDEVRQLRALGYTDVKIKIGGVPLAEDLRRIEAVARLLPDADCLAVDAMNTYNPSDSMVAALELLPCWPSPRSRHPALRPRSLLRRPGIPADRRPTHAPRMAPCGLLAAWRAPLLPSPCCRSRTGRRRVQPTMLRPFWRVHQ